jgi:hypothetical protein
MRLVGSHTLDGSGTSGSFVDANLSNGTPFFSFQPQNIWGQINMNTARPLIVISGTTVSWSYSPSGASQGYFPIPGTIFYGIY